jgi:hypothetical protein
MLGLSERDGKDEVARGHVSGPVCAAPWPLALAENDLKLWRKDMWCIPQVDGTYVARMEGVLDLYAEAPDPTRPVACFDESPTQRIGEVRQAIPASRGSPSAMTASIGATGRSTCSCKHASWLNMVEIEIGVLRSQCLDRRIGERERLVSEIAAWEQQRNTEGARITWMFTTERARTKMAYRAEFSTIK